jgi:hypothetical protein
VQRNVASGDFGDVLKTEIDVARAVIDREVRSLQSTYVSPVEIKPAAIVAFVEQVIGFFRPREAVKRAEGARHGSNVLPPSWLAAVGAGGICAQRSVSTDVDDGLEINRSAARRSRMSTLI